MNAVAPNGIWRAFSKLRSRFRAVHTAAQLQARGARAGPRAMLTQRHANVQTPAVAGGRLLKATSPAQAAALQIALAAGVVVARTKTRGGARDDDAAATRAGSPNKPPADAPTKDKSCDGFRAREDEKENIDPVTGARARLASGRAAASGGASPSRVVPALSSFRLDSAIWFFFSRLDSNAETDALGAIPQAPTSRRRLANPRRAVRGTPASDPRRRRASLSRTSRASLFRWCACRRFAFAPVFWFSKYCSRRCERRARGSRIAPPPRLLRAHRLTRPTDALHQKRLNPGKFSITVGGKVRRRSSSRTSRGCPARRSISIALAPLFRKLVLK